MVACNPADTFQEIAALQHEALDYSMERAVLVACGMQIPPAHNALVG
jgi:hypothetical protein